MIQVVEENIKKNTIVWNGVCHKYNRRLRKHKNEKFWPWITHTHTHTHTQLIAVEIDGVYIEYFEEENVHKLYSR